MSLPLLPSSAVSSPAISPLARVPREILVTIAFELAAQQPLGPPHILLPLIRTSSHLYNALSAVTNPGLWARIFRFKFDSAAVRRRAFTPTVGQYVEQLQQYCRAMQALRRTNPYTTLQAEAAGDFDELELHDHLVTATVMMFEDDGRNARQLVEWAHADTLVDAIVRTRLYEGAHDNNGWAPEACINATAITLMWMLTSEETIKSQTLAQRKQLIELLLPFVVTPYRYAASHAPAQHFYLPLSTLPTAAPPTTILTAHGPYPVYVRPRPTSEVYYSTRIHFMPPLTSPAAKLLFFALSERTPLPIAPHLAEDRAAWLARNHNDTTGVAATREDMEEFNWGWSARLPLGRGILNKSPLGVRFWDPPEEVVIWSWATSPLNPRWRGKAPHTTWGEGVQSKSAAWDADWWRARMCGDPERPMLRVPYGKLYRPGCLEGLWHGRMVMPEQGSIQHLIGTAQHPTPGTFTEESLRLLVQPMYMQLREAHAVPDDVGAPNLGPAPDADDANMVNAWFAGVPGSTTFVAHDDTVQLQVADTAGGVRSRVLRCWHGKRGEGQGLGNAIAGEDAGVGRGEDEDEDEWPMEGEDVQHEEGWKGWAHDSEACDECMARARVARRLAEEERQRESERTMEVQRERTFADVGLGMEGEIDMDMDVDEEESDSDEEEDEEGSDAGSYDTELDEWDERQLDDVAMDGTPSPALPLAHDRRKLAAPKCDGVKEIYLFGESGTRHGDAFDRYRFYGRVRAWDGLVGIIRTARRPGEGNAGSMLFYGYLVGDENFVGNWRITSVDGPLPAWEGAFSMARRRD